MATIRIGTCSWKFASWVGLVYSDTQESNYLREYASRYRTVEIDQWFWSLFGQDTLSLPQQKDVQAYRRAVPDDFCFSVKAPNSVTLTHPYRKEKSHPLTPNAHFLSAPLARQFLSTLEPLRDVLGPVMFQFEYLNQQKMSSQDRFQALVGEFAAKLPAGYTFAIETRNPPYLNHAYFELLAQLRFVPVLLQGYWMPPVAQLYQKHRPAILQHETAIVRLLGPDRHGIEEKTGKRWDQIVTPRDRELGEISEVIRDLESAGLDVYVNVNNHYEGSAPLTIARLEQLLAAPEPPAI